MNYSYYINIFNQFSLNYKMKVGIIGIGMVGGATKELLNPFHEIFSYDKYKEPYNSDENIKKLAENSEAVFICVPTPMKPSGEIDYSPIRDSLDLLQEKVTESGRNSCELIVIIRSTAVSGSTDKFAKSYPFRFVFNPEFLRENHALEDMKNTSRIILGAESEEDYKKVEEVYKPIFPDAKYIFVNRKTAEMIKYAANVTLTGQVAIANEIYKICKSLGIDYDLVRETILLDERIGTNTKVPGPDGDLGFGGKCFPKDLNALIYLARENLYRPYLLEEIWRLNERIRKNKDWLNIDGATSEDFPNNS